MQARNMARWVMGIGVLAASIVGATAARAAAEETEQDLGPTPGADVMDVSLILKLKHEGALESYVSLTQRPGQPGYHRFLSVREFTAGFAPSVAEIATIKRYLARYGISVTDVYADRLVVKARGSVAAFESAFSFDVHDHASHGRRFRRAHRQPRIPVLLRDLLIAVTGPSSEALFAPRHVRTSRLGAPLDAPEPVLPAAGATATGVPGSFTVGDAAQRYGALPLYDAAIDGRGSTVGIATLAGFDPADAFTYWDLVGLATDPGRIEQVHVDGGGLVNDPNDPAGPDASLETVLDVQQAGGIAPGADVIVYDAPNTDAGFLDLFYRAASENRVDSLSVSWGLAEVAAFEELGGGGPAVLVALHQALLEAAAQGISVFAAAGDGGAYDINSGVNQPVHNVLTVDSPASDPLVTAAGGTTVPYTAGIAGAPPFVVTTEQVWGWRGLEEYLVTYLDPTLEGALFPLGGGGGVSVYWPRPAYQSGTSGIRRSQAGQSIVFDDPAAGSVDLLDMPADFAGRNVPDVSLNADPQTGYLVYWATAGGLLDGIGGTSVVSPQLNGMSALVSAALGTRLGAWNPMLYRFKRAYGNASEPPLVDVTAGDNWFYDGVPGFEPAAGLGVLNLASFVAAVEREMPR